MSIEIRKEDEHPSGHMLTRYHAGDLPPEDRERIGGHLQDCQSCMVFLEDLEQAKKNFHAANPRDAFLARARVAAAESPEAPAWWNRLLRPAALLAAAAALVVLLLVPWRSPDEPTERIKGGPIELGYFVMEDSGPVVAAPDRILHPGDRIQFRLTAPAGGFVHVVGIDQSETVSVYYPLPDETVREFPGGAGRPVPGSVILDEILGAEKVFVLICEQPVARDRLLDKLKSVPGGPAQLRQQSQLPLDCRQASLVLHKE